MVCNVSPGQDMCSAGIPLLVCEVQQEGGRRWKGRPRQGMSACRVTSLPSCQRRRCSEESSRRTSPGGLEVCAGCVAVTRCKGAGE